MSRERMFHFQIKKNVLPEKVMPKLKFQGRNHAHLRESNNLDMTKYCVAAVPGAWGHVRKPHVEVYMARSE